MISEPRHFSVESYDHVQESSMDPERIAEVYKIPLQLVHQIQMDKVSYFQAIRLLKGDEPSQPVL